MGILFSMNTKTRLGISIATIVGAILLLVWQHFMHAGLSIDLTQARLEEVNRRYEEINASEEAYDEVKARYDQTMKTFMDLQAEVPDRDGFIQAMNYIRNTATRQNINLLSIEPNLEDAWPDIKSNLTTTTVHMEKYPVSMTFEGDYLSIGVFLDTLNNGPFNFNIGRLELASELGSEGTLNAKCMLFAYMFVNENG